ncbi:bifunctional metallophosphatase/5'-nucleotidase, partial [Streptomyces sp. SID11233]|nr:bifunctional metallophosphatase/5'-nucleotidase [Streptomyces sp. SID11233]
WERGRWSVERVASRVLNSNEVAEDVRITRLLAKEHREVVAYVNQVIGSSVVEMSTAEGTYKDVPMVDLINHVQAETVRGALAGGEYADLPVLSQASPFSRTARFPAGEVTIKDAAGLYTFENTLEARLITGAQLREYLEYSAKFFVRTAVG